MMGWVPQTKVHADTDRSERAHRRGEKEKRGEEVNVRRAERGSLAFVKIFLGRAKRRGRWVKRARRLLYYIATRGIYDGDPKKKNRETHDRLVSGVGV